MASFPHLTQMEHGLAGASHGTPSFLFCHGAATADSASLETSSGVLDTSPQGTASDDKKARKPREDSASFSSAHSKVVLVHHKITGACKKITMFHNFSILRKKCFITSNTESVFS